MPPTVEAAARKDKGGRYPRPVFCLQRDTSPAGEEASRDGWAVQKKQGFCPCRTRRSARSDQDGQRGKKEEAPLIIGAIHVGSITDAGYNQAQHDGLTYLKNNVSGLKIIEAKEPS